MVKIAIVGSLGFIGTQLAKTWKIQNDELHLFNSKDTLIDGKGNVKEDFLQCNLVIWAAGRANPSSSESKNATVIDELRTWNRILDASAGTSSTANKRFIFLSSGGCTYTAPNLPYFEGDEATGTNKYGKMKLQQEKLLTERIPNSSVIRLSNVYGYGQPTGKGQGVIAEWLLAIRTGKNPKVYGLQNSFRDYIHITDAVNAIELVAKSSHRGIFNVGSGEPTTLSALMEIFLKITNKDLKFDVHESRVIDRKGYFLSIDKIQEILGWQPRLSIYEGIKKTLSTTLIEES